MENGKWRQRCVLPYKNVNSRARNGKVEKEKRRSGRRAENEPVCVEHTFASHSKLFSHNVRHCTNATAAAQVKIERTYVEHICAYTHLQNSTKFDDVRNKDLWMLADFTLYLKHFIPNSVPRISHPIDRYSCIWTRMCNHNSIKCICTLMWTCAIGRHAVNEVHSSISVQTMRFCYHRNSSSILINYIMFTFTIIYFQAILRHEDAQKINIVWCKHASKRNRVKSWLWRRRRRLLRPRQK